MSLDSIRDKSRAAIHGQFSLPAVVRSPDGLVEIPVDARMHRDLKKFFGDLEREGFAQVIEQYNQLIFDSEQWYPVRGYTVDFGRKRVFEIHDILSDRGDRYIRAEVTIAKAAP